VRKAIHEYYPNKIGLCQCEQCRTDGDPIEDWLDDVGQAAGFMPVGLARERAQTAFRRGVFLGFVLAFVVGTFVVAFSNTNF